MRMVMRMVMVMAGRMIDGERQTERVAKERGSQTPRFFFL